MGDDTENVWLTIDDIVQLNEHRNREDGKDFWRVDRQKTRRVDLPCFAGQPVHKSFVLQLDAIHEDGNRRVGTVKVTLQREAGEVRQAYEMKHGERIRDLRRRARIDGETFWVTRVVPVDATANYVLKFKITGTM